MRPKKLRQPLASKIRTNSSNSTDTWIRPKKLKHSQSHRAATSGQKLKQHLPPQIAIQTNDYENAFAREVLRFEAVAKIA